MLHGSGCTWLWFRVAGPADGVGDGARWCGANPVLAIVALALATNLGGARVNDSIATSQSSKLLKLAVEMNARCRVRSWIDCAHLLKVVKDEKKKDRKSYGGQERRE